MDPHGPISDEKWSRTHQQKNYGVMGGEKWSQQLSTCRYLSTDLSTWSIDHGQYRLSIRIHLLEKSISTVDADSPTENYCRSSMVD